MSHRHLSQEYGMQSQPVHTKQPKVPCVPYSPFLVFLLHKMTAMTETSTMAQSTAIGIMRYRGRPVLRAPRCKQNRFFKQEASYDFQLKAEIRAMMMDIFPGG